MRQGHYKGRELAVVKPSELDIVPEPPSGLLKVSRERWAMYWASPVSKAIDMDADGQRLERWIRSVDEWYRVGREFRKDRIVSGSQGQPVLNPLGSYLTQVESQITKAEMELGLTPMARMRLGIVTGEAKLTAMELNRRLNKSEQPNMPTAAIEAQAHEMDDAEWVQA